MVAVITIKSVSAQQKTAHQAVFWYYQPTNSSVN